MFSFDGYKIEKYSFLIREADSSMKGVGVAIHLADGQKNICLLDQKEIKVIWERAMPKPRRSHYTSRGVFIEEYLHNKHSRLTLLDLENGKTLWTTDLTAPGRYHDPFDRTWKPGELRRILGLHRGRVYVAITNDTILELDARTGRTERRWRELPEGKTWGDPSGFNALPQPHHSLLIPSEDKLVGLTGHRYWEIDLESGALSFTNLSSLFQPLELNANAGIQLTPHEDLLFFSSDFTTSDAGGRVVSILQSAAFDRRTKAVVWRQAFPHPGGGTYQVKTPVVAGRRVLVLDTRGALHIFERTT